MEPGLIIVMGFSYFFSSILVVKLWIKPNPIILKGIYTLILAVPVVGLILYLFAADTTQSQNEDLKNSSNVGGFGSYTQRWIGRRSLYKEIIRERQEKLNTFDKDNGERSENPVTEITKVTVTKLAK